MAEVEFIVILLQLLYGKLYLFVAWAVTMVTICIACLFMAPDFSATMQRCRLLHTTSPVCYVDEGDTDMHPDP